MKIVFIEPRSKETNVYSKLYMPLLGPVYLATILKKYGHKVDVINENIYQPDYKDIKADIICISILTPTANRGYEIAKKFPKDKVIMGGVHASLLPEEALNFSRQVVVGEAEEVIVDLVEGRLKDEIIYTKPIENLDKIPFADFSLIKGYNPKNRIIPVLTSRGCPFNCSFCSVTKLFGHKYRFRSPENVIKELKGLPSNNLFFCDDNFSASIPRAKDLLSKLIKEKYYFTTQLRCDTTLDLNLLSKAGCRNVCIGFESINSKTLEEYNKNQTVDDIISAIENFHKNKIRIHGMFVLGSDLDTKETILNTASFAIKNKIDTIQLMILTPFPGTKVYNIFKNENRIFTLDWNLYDGQHVVFKPKLLSPKELQIFVLKSYFKFYSVLNSFSLLLKLNLRNAFFRFMGYKILKEWNAKNYRLDWLNNV